MSTLQRGFLALALLTVAAPAYAEGAASEPPSSDAWEPAMRVAYKCTARAIADLDDGVTDATTVERAARRACRDEYAAAEALYFEGLPPNARTDLGPKLEAIRDNMGVSLVLKYRRWLRDQNPSN